MLGSARSHLSSATTLVELLSAADFTQSAWGRQHRVWRNAVDPTTYIGLGDVQQLMDASLLRWPYFTLLRDGKQIPSADCTTSRDVIGQRKHGYPHAAKIRQLMRDGASLKLNQLGDWHRQTAQLESALAGLLGATPSSYIFWTPAAQRGMRPHRDAAHVLAVQLVGSKRWQIYADAVQISSHAGLDVDVRSPTHTVNLSAGDVLYLPHGWPHAADAIDGESMHLTFTLATPTPSDMLEAVLATFRDQYPDLVHRHHALPLLDKSRAVHHALASVVEALDADEWLTTALKVKG